MEKRDIQKYIEEFRVNLMPTDFKWRSGQMEAVEGIVDAYFSEKYQTVILDAPVGSGKSIIAMCASWILNRFKKNGYILASDLSLQEQYEKDLKRLDFAWGSIKGLDNYTCVDNMEKISMGTCKMRRVDPKKMNCYGECPYYKAREKAARSSTSILNYHYWLVMQNEVNSVVDEDKQIFPKRDFTICDEAHKILDIIQGNYSPKLSMNSIEKIDTLGSFFKTYKVGDLSGELREIQSAFSRIQSEERNVELFELLQSINNSLSRFVDFSEKTKKIVAEEYKHNPPKAWKKALWMGDWVIGLSRKLSAYIDVIQKTDVDKIVKNPSGDEIIFNCLEENYLMHNYFHTNTGFRILMSATFSDPVEYIKSLGLKGAKYIKLESDFNFDKSPIIFYNKRKMSYNHIQTNLPWLLDKTNEIIENHAGQSGLIHSASYDLALKIYNGLSAKNKRRCLIYNGSSEKREFLEVFKRSKGKILIGPSLLEGLDLNGNLARFQIFAKVPYLSLGDRFVKTKMATNPGWYRWKAVINIIQGTGRIVRSQDDWGITYMLDGSLGDLIHMNRKAFPHEFMKRIVLA